MSTGAVFGLKVYAEDGVFYEGPCSEVVIPCIDGEKAFLAHHEDAVYAVYNGLMRFFAPSKGHSKDGDEEQWLWQDAVIGTGVVHFADNECVVLTETAERPDEIDEKRAEAALQRARDKMMRDVSMREYRISQMAMARATARLRAASRKDR